MKHSSTIRMGIDLLMTVVLLLLMTYELLGQAFHEWLGMAMAGLWIAHHVLNRNWYCNLFRGKYPVMRIVQIIFNLLLLVTMVGSMSSGIILSKYVFKGLNISAGYSLARTVHMLCAYWGFLLMSFHIGLHWSMMFRWIKKRYQSRKFSVFSCMIVVCVSGYGVYAFWKRDILSNLLLKTEFVFFDSRGSILLFFADYIAIMGLFILIGQFFIRIVNTLKKNRRNL